MLGLLIFIVAILLYLSQFDTSPNYPSTIPSTVNSAALGTQRFQDRFELVQTRLARYRQHEAIRAALRQLRQVLYGDQDIDTDDFALLQRLCQEPNLTLPGTDNQTVDWAELNLFKLAVSFNLLESRLRRLEWDDNVF